jgi:mannitol-specific phosphotransferase system IIBC component
METILSKDIACQIQSVMLPPTLIICSPTHVLILKNCIDMC